MSFEVMICISLCFLITSQVFLYFLFWNMFRLMKDIYSQLIDVYSVVCDSEKAYCRKSLSSDVRDLKSSYDGLSELIVKYLFDMSFQKRSN